MLVHDLFALALLAGTAVAKPVRRHHLPKRQYTNSSIPGITQTSLEARSAATTADTTPTCSTTYTPSDDHDCSDIAVKHGIQLSDPEAKYDSTSTKCKDILRGYGICPEEARATSSSSAIVTAAPSHVAALNGTSSNSTALNGTAPLHANTTMAGNSTTNATAVHAGLVTLTELNRATLTYTEGTGSATRERVVTITHTTIDVITESDLPTTTGKANGPGSSASGTTSSSGETPSAFPKTDQTIVTSSRSISVVDASSPHGTSTMSSAAIAHNGAVTASAVASACEAAVLPAAVPTQEGIVQGCSKWYIAVPGDYCSSISERFGVPVDTFMGWNPAVNPPTCPNMLAGNAYCVETCGGAAQGTPSTVPSSLNTMTSSSLRNGPAASSSTLTMPTISTSSTAMAAPVSSGSSTATTTMTGAASPSSSSSAEVYKTYLGDGSEAAGWPAMSSWIDFDSMFAANQPDMKESCAQWGVPNDSDAEISEMKSAIQQVATTNNVDPRFLLAIIMQESTGCVRVITTQYSVFNPGLMQSHNGTGSCNENNVSRDIPSSGPYHSDLQVQTPCPATEITQMIKDGTEGTSSGDGLKQLLAQQQSAGFSGVEAYYRTARAYNGGSVAASGLLEDGCCTRSYASDVANRLTGWTNAPRTFSG